jgi:hypothetical protein
MANWVSNQQLALLAPLQMIGACKRQWSREDEAEGKAARCGRQSASWAAVTLRQEIGGSRERTSDEAITPH